MTPRQLAIGGFTAVAVFLGAIVFEAPLLQALAKPIPVLILALWAFRQPGRDAAWIAAGLGFSALGDLLLAQPVDAFVFGLLAFLIAHLLYLSAFVLRTRAPALGWAVPVTAFGIGVFVTLQHDVAGPRTVGAGGSRTTRRPMERSRCREFCAERCTRRTQSVHRGIVDDADRADAALLERPVDVGRLGQRSEPTSTSARSAMSRRPGLSGE